MLLEYETKLSTLGLETLKFYSPLNIKSAQTNALSSKKNASQAKYYLISALKNIDYASKNKMAVKMHLKKSDTHFEELNKLNTQLYLPEDFKKIQSKFAELITLIELGDIQHAISLEENLIEDMLNLEIKTLIKIHLGDANSLIQESKELDADDFSPNSLKEAKRSIQATEQYITKSYRDRNGIIKRARETKQLAKTAYYVAQAAQQIHSSSNKEIEDQIINNFAYLDKIKSAIAVKDSTIESYPLKQERTLSLVIAKQLELSKNIELEQCLTQNRVLVDDITKLEEAALYQNRSIISEETNKAVLPELFMDQGYSEEVMFDE